MDGISNLAFGQKFLQIYGPMGLGWVAWIFTMFYLRAERKRYQDLVILIVQYFTKVNMLERSESHEVSPLDFLLNRRRTPPREPEPRRSTRHPAYDEPRDEQE